METNQILQTDVLDIIFEGRNKMYGAYELRKSYNKRLQIAVSVMIGTCLFAFLITVAAKKEEHHQIVLMTDGEITLQKTEPPPPPVPPPPPPPPPPAPKQIITIKFTTPVFTETTATPPPAQSSMDDIAIGKIDNNIGDSSDVIAPPPEPRGTGKVVAPQIDDLKDEVFFVQKEAQFPGGANAWKRFLERNLKADTPLDNGAPAGTYRVVVSFLVDKEGNVSEVTALNDPGFGTAAEAVRAIQIGPKWLPALQNGRNVIYRQRQTITFRVEDAQ